MASVSDMREGGALRAKMKWIHGIDKRFSSLMTNLMETYSELKVKIDSLISIKLSLELEVETLRSKTEEYKRQISVQSSQLEKIQQNYKQIKRHHKHELLTVNPRKVSVGLPLSTNGGSACVVYSCHLDGWQCVMKEFRINEAPESNLQAFENEIEVLRSLPPHPNICQYLFHLKTENRIRLFITQYNSTLRTTIYNRNDNHFKLFQLQHFILNIGQGLAFLHSSNIIHRDLKSENIFVLYNEEKEIRKLLIGDFDTAVNLSTQQPTECIGTPHYMAPEVISCANRTPYDEKADVYSFGMLIFEMMTLRVPYFDVPHLNLYNVKMSEVQPTFPEKFPVAVFQPIIPLYQKCISFKPKERPTAQIVVQELRSQIGEPQRLSSDSDEGNQTFRDFLTSVNSSSLGNSSSTTIGNSSSSTSVNSSPLRSTREPFATLDPNEKEKMERRKSTSFVLVKTKAEPIQVRETVLDLSEFLKQAQLEITSTHSSSALQPPANVQKKKKKSKKLRASPSFTNEKPHILERSTSVLKQRPILKSNNHPIQSENLLDLPLVRCSTNEALVSTTLTNSEETKEVDVYEFLQSNTLVPPKRKNRSIPNNFKEAISQYLNV